MRERYLEAWDKNHKIIPDGGERAYVEAGTTGWRSPLPLIKDAAGWYFDVEAGRKEMEARLIGRNELAVVQTMLAIVDAQRDYAASDPMENTPNSSPGVLLPPPKARAGELLIRQRAKKLGVPVIAAHRAVLTQKLDHNRLPKLLHPGNERAQQILAEHMRNRAACFWATDCGRGCSIRATYQSTTVHLPPAMSTGNLDICTQAMVREVELDKNGLASGVVFVDRATGQEHRAKARVVVLAASACETVRIILNSKSSRFPQGLANSSGKVGKYLMSRSVRRRRR